MERRPADVVVLVHHAGEFDAELLREPADLRVDENDFAGALPTERERGSGGQLLKQVADDER